jgi:hypothetical protein
MSRRGGFSVGGLVLALALVIVAVLPASASAGVKIAGSVDTICALKSGGKVLCWGDDTYGQLDVPPPLDG